MTKYVAPVDRPAFVRGRVYREYVATIIIQSATLKIRVASTSVKRARLFVTNSLYAEYKERFGGNKSKFFISLRIKYEIGTSGKHSEEKIIGVEEIVDDSP